MRFIIVTTLLGLGGAPPAASPAEEGIPITSAAVRAACEPCHKADEQGRLTRISYRRTTPEGWQLTLRRMASLNGAPLEPGPAREILRDLSNQLGLAPEEARPATFEAERRLIDHSYTDKDTAEACARCHSMGRVIAQRRTREEWELVVAMHRGYYPLSDFQAFRRMGPPETTPGPDGRPPDKRHPVEKAVDHLAQAFPLRTPEWAAWSANRRPPRLTGRWALSGHQAGRGAIYGRFVVAAKPGSEDEFVTESRWLEARSGASVERSGQAIVYTGFQWRGRSFAGAARTNPLREVMFVERDQARMWGRVFSGAYDEIGLDVTLERLGDDPVVLGVWPTALRTGSAAQSVRLFGANFASDLAPTDIDFGRGVKVTRIASASADSLALDVDVAADAPVGARDVFVSGASRAAAAVVYAAVDALEVTPGAGMARIGGIQMPKQLQQFEAVASSYGQDGKAGTPDDLSLGVVDVAWGLEEYPATFDDDDARHVGTIDSTGLFTPGADGPNPRRRGSRNNVGDVWVVATLPAESPLKPARPLRARAHLLVTVPLYVRWDQPEVNP